jgi:hypothetical protein
MEKNKDGVMVKKKWRKSSLKLSKDLVLLIDSPQFILFLIFFPYHLPMGLHINDSVFLGCEQVETLIFMHKLKKKAFSYLPKNVKGEPSASP